jgi:hypothetical protein
MTDSPLPRSGDGPRSASGRLAVLATLVPGMAPRAPKRNLLVLACYLLVTTITASSLAATMSAGWT